MDIYMSDILWTEAEESIVGDNISTSWSDPQQAWFVIQNVIL